MKLKVMRCECHPDSPFRYKEWTRKSIFLQDISYRASKDGQTLGQMSTAQVERARQEGKNAGYIKGIARNKEAEILRMRTFSIFAQPVVKPITGDVGDKDA